MHYASFSLTFEIVCASCTTMDLLKDTVVSFQLVVSFDGGEGRRIVEFRSREKHLVELSSVPDFWQLC